MATDMHIHVDNGMTQDDYHCIFSSQSGSIYLKDTYGPCPAKPEDPEQRCAHWEKTWAMPRIFVDTTPWPLPNMLPKPQEEQDAIPDPMGDIADLFPEQGLMPSTTITADIIERVERALTIPERFISKYPGFTAAGRRDEIIGFLREHQGRGAYIMFY